MGSPLGHITVLDLSSLLPGPFCSMILADFGARVIKIERPGEGDIMRDYLPRYPLYSGNFSVLNRNKESLTLNLKSPQGLDIMRRLVQRSDILLEGFRPGVMERLGLGYEALSQLNPGLIYCAISGFGHHSPYRDVAAHDINYIGLNGILDLNGVKDGPPVLPGVLVADLGGGAYPAVVGMLLALLEREKSRRGQFIDIAMMDGAFFWLYHAAGTYFTSGETPTRGRELTNGGSPRYQVYATQDGHYLAVGALEDHFWNNLCDLLEIDDPAVRLHDRENPQLAIDTLAARFRQKTAAQWAQAFAGKEVCSNLVRDFGQAAADPHFQVRGMLQRLRGPDGVEQTVLGNPICLSETPADIRRPAPTLGADNRKILAELGYTDRDCEALSRAGVL